MLKSVFFFLLGVLPFSAMSQSPIFQLMYENITRPNGGSVGTGDIIEIKGVATIPSGVTVEDIRFNGTVPPGTTYIPGTLAVKTNEGLTNVANTGTFTDASGDDAAHITGSNIFINLGETPGVPPGISGTIVGGQSIPRFYSAMTIVVASFRVVVNASDGGKINITGCSFRMKGGNNNLDNVVIRVNTNYGCGALDPTNQLNNEAYGSFTTGTIPDRNLSLHVAGYNYSTIGSYAPNMGQYSIVRNSSPTQYSGSTPAPSDRVNTQWDVFGDHSGTTNSAGNLPAANNVSAGYMLLVNGSHETSTVFVTSLTGLLPNSQYTLRFWVRNACGVCAGDPTKDGPMVPNQPGVKPLLAVEFDGEDAYTTGPVTYTNGWVEKSFTFTTGNKGNLDLKIRNLAPGGGGNDFAFDDLSLQQCLIILPGVVNDIKAENAGEKNIISWNAADESQVIQYTVEYSYDGKDFSKAGHVKPGSTNGSYQFDDFRPVQGKIYYRLVTLTKSGQSYYSKTAILRSTATGVSGIRVTPNPVVDFPRIEVNSTMNQGVRLEIFDATGRRMQQVSQSVKKGVNPISINTVKLIKGLYVLVARFDNGETMATRFVVAGQ